MLEQLVDDRNPSVSGILAGISKGKVWLFEETNPTFAVVYSYCVGGCGLAGSIKPECKDKIKIFLNHVFNDLKAEGKNCFEFSAEEETLYKQIFSLFPEKTLYSEVEYSYRLTRSYENLPDKIQEFRIQKVNELVLEKLLAGTYNNSVMFLERYQNSWRDSKQFLTYSRSFLVIKNNEIVGVIFGSSRFKDIITVDIEVNSRYRKQGLASLLSYHMLNDCWKDHITLQWDHVESNIASKRLAEKIGFRLFKTRPYYWFDLSEE
ncbi:MAG: GNAT family N-acetyltransferase [bacterium]|nr:GNAT family N-acetyltransferase [bacterium]